MSTTSTQYGAGELEEFCDADLLNRLSHESRKEFSARLTRSRCHDLGSDPSKRRAMIMSNLKESKLLRSEWKTSCFYDSFSSVQSRKRALLDKRRISRAAFSHKEMFSETSTDSEPRSHHGSDPEHKGSLIDGLHEVSDLICKMTGLDAKSEMMQTVSLTLGEVDFSLSFVQEIDQVLLPDHEIRDAVKSFKRPDIGYFHSVGKSQANLKQPRWLG
eukprot:763297-Hanusia_phi.AAC.1